MSDIFKAYDIRGIYPGELDEKSAFKIGRAFAVLIKKEAALSPPARGRDKGGGKLTVAVGQDMRVSSPALARAVMDGIVSQGVNVADIGLASTTTFYFGVSYYGFDGGLQVSASHNPARYNGFKMTRANAVPIGGETGIGEIKEMVLAGNFSPPSGGGARGGAVRGKITAKKGVLNAQIKFALKYVGVKKIKPFKIVIDTANGMGGPQMEELFKHLHCDLVKMNFELDGTFPNHEADPLKDENNRDLQKKVLEEGADLGIAFDGDADRIFFVDDKGKTVEPAIVRGILARIFLRENPGAAICYDIRPGRITEDMIKEAGGVPVVTRVGHSLIKEKMRETGAVFAGESSGHFFIKMPHGSFEEPDIVILKLLREFSESGKSLSEYIKPLQKYFHSGEINFEVAGKEAVFARLKEKYGANLKYDFDGLSFEWPDFWFNVRASNTENKMRLNLEAMNEKLMNEKTKEVSDIIKLKI